MIGRGASSRWGLLVLVGWCGALGACSVDGRSVSVVGSSSSNGNGELDGRVASNRPGGGAPPASVADAGVSIACTVGAFSPQCPEVSCPPDDGCRNFAPRVPAGTCVAPGRCATVESCIVVWTEAARAGEACLCTEDGCTLDLGASCADATDCASGTCVADNAGGSVCCAQSCPVGQSCSANGQFCQLAPVCTNGTLRCSGSILQTCVSRQWLDTLDCGTPGCNPAGRCNGQPETPPPATPPETPPPSMPPATPSTPPAQGLCSDSCSVLFEQANGACSDTGQNFAACDPGTDCTDCGMRASGCTDTCTTLQFAGDGDCDDGREGSFTNLCAPGTDCTDCGVLLP